MKKIALDFTLPDQNGKFFNLYDNIDKKVLLVFYPKDNSMVCSRQLKNYSDSDIKFQAAGIRLVGINGDSKEEHSSFCSQKQINMTLLSDPGMKVIKAFGALYPLNLVKRKLVLINTKKEIIFEKVLMPYTYWNDDRILNFLAKNQLI